MFFSMPDRSTDVKGKIAVCVSKANKSPVTATLKCPHEEGEDINESEAVTEGSGDGIGGGEEDHLGGSGRENRGFPPASQADLAAGKRDLMVLSSVPFTTLFGRVTEVRAKVAYGLNREMGISMADAI
jgi:hypothetical protein